MDAVVNKPKAFGVGLIALDLVMGADPNSPVRSWAGGTCGNLMSILAYLGWDAFPIARMNGDPASERVRADMMRWGYGWTFRIARRPATPRLSSRRFGGAAMGQRPIDSPGHARIADNGYRGSRL